MSKVYLIVENFNGKIFVSVDHTGIEGSHAKGRNPRPKRILLEADEVALGLTELKLRYAKQITEAFETPKDRLLAEANEKREKLKKTLEGIIATCEDKGQVQAAKAAWKQITGVEHA